MQEQTPETTESKIENTAPTMLEHGVALIKSIAKHSEESHQAHASRLVSMMPDILIEVAKLEDRMMDARSYLVQVEDWCKRVSDGTYASVVDTMGDDGKKKYSNEEKRQAILKELLNANPHWDSSQIAIKQTTAQIQQMTYNINQYRRVREFALICINFATSITEVITDERHND